MWTFDTPGWEDSDLPPGVRDEWHKWHAREANDNIMGMLRLVGSDDPSSIPYVDPSREQIPSDRGRPVSVDWEGFPAKVTARFGFGEASLMATEGKGYEDIVGIAADGYYAGSQTGEKVDCMVRHRQDEYLEWHAERAAGKLQAVTFVSEGYDYWKFLFENGEHQRVVDYYQQVTGNTTLTRRDLEATEDIYLYSSDGTRVARLVEKGRYNYRNQFNQTAGIVHLSHGANSLGAEVNLAVTSCLPRTDSAGELVTGDRPKRLLCCTAGGDPNRSSDAIIAAGAYGEVTNPNRPKRFTLTNPVGLYIKTFNYSALRLPSGDSAPREWWKVCRGSDASDPNDPWDSRILRLRVEVPKGEQWVLGDLTLGGGPLKHPAQLARLISMHLLVDTWDVADYSTMPIPCSAGCCIAEGVLSRYHPGESCSDGAQDAFPGLVGPATTAELDAAIAHR